MRSKISHLRCVMALVYLTSACLLSTFVVFGQGTNAAVSPELVSLPKAVWPMSASPFFGNIVMVNVDVNEKGRVTSVISVDGPGQVCPGASSPEITKLREAAKSVVLKARFKPAQVDGKKIASTATIEVVFADPPRAALMRADATVVRGRGVEGPDNSNLKTVQGESTTDRDKLVMRETATAGDDRVAAKPAAAPVEMSSPPAAQDMKPSATSKTVSGGVLNGKAMSLAKPTYPPAAKAVRAAGSVNVQVLIGEDGSLLSANAVSGHPLLRSASRIAACSSKFSPTLLMGNPVKVSGVITYNFVP